MRLSTKLPRSTMYRYVGSWRMRYEPDLLSLLKREKESRVILWFEASLALSAFNEFEAEGAGAGMPCPLE